MLILTRKIDQGIVISGNIYVRVLGVQRDRVKIGISAPVDIAVLRQELLDHDIEATSNEESAAKGPSNGSDTFDQDYADPRQEKRTAREG